MVGWQLRSEAVALHKPPTRVNHWLKRRAWIYIQNCPAMVFQSKACDSSRTLFMVAVRLLANRVSGDSAVK